MSHVRCFWCNLKNPTYIKYHDSEWCVPTYNDAMLFELLVLESFQAGLSWETVLNKRDNFRRAFDNFDPKKISQYGEEKIALLLSDAGIIRSRRKIEAAIRNSNVFMRIQEEWAGFHRYIWHFTEGKTVYEIGRTHSALSDQISADLKKRGMTFVGTTIIYSYLQAIGIIYSHDENCFLYQENPSG